MSIRKVLQQYPPQGHSKLSDNADAPARGALLALIQRDMDGPVDMPENGVCDDRPSAGCLPWLGFVSLEILCHSLVNSLVNS